MPGSVAATDSKGMENWILLPLCALVIIIGVYPSSLLDVSDQSVQEILKIFNDHHPLTGGL
jgi:NADH:ubiquinone oxidoreductase subunit 4 (subunit M)